jgi:SAM-dependent methyltransferase
MELEYYREYAEVEDTHWWFRGRRAVLRRLLAQVARPGLRILDVGFGTGAMLRFLADYGEVIGMDASLEAIRFARERSGSSMLAGDVLHLPLRSHTVDVVTAFDIIEHVDDDAAALAELARVCRPGGYVVLTVPAFPFLWGIQDVISHHRRRYTQRELGARVEAAGLRIRTLTHFNALLLPAVAAVRLARRLRGAQPGPPKSDFTLTRPGLLNDMLTRIFAAEGLLVAHWRLPVGVSLICLAERAGEA